MNKYGSLDNNKTKSQGQIDDARYVSILSIYLVAFLTLRDQGNTAVSIYKSLMLRIKVHPLKTSNPGALFLFIALVFMVFCDIVFLNKNRYL